MYIHEMIKTQFSLDLYLNSLSTLNPLYEIICCILWALIHQSNFKLLLQDQMAL